MDKKLLALITLFFISFAFFAILMVFNKPITQLTRAKEDFIPSAERSKIIAWPLEVKANGVNEAVINVFIVSESDKPLSNKVVTLTTTCGQLKQSASTTDNNGKATFQLSSNNPGCSAVIGAMVEPNIILTSNNTPKKVSIKFN